MSPLLLKEHIFIFLFVPTIKHEKNITICHLKINIFTAVTYCNILYGRVIVMHVETAYSLFEMRRSRKFSRGGVTFRPGWIQLYQWSRHKSIKKGRSWHRFLLLVHSEARTRFYDILINLSPQILGILRLYFPLSREKMMVGPGTVSVRLGRLL